MLLQSLESQKTYFHISKFSGCFLADTKISNQDTSRHTVGQSAALCTVERYRQYVSYFITIQERLIPCITIVQEDMSVTIVLSHFLFLRVYLFQTGTLGNLPFIPSNLKPIWPGSKTGNRAKISFILDQFPAVRKGYFERLGHRIQVAYLEEQDREPRHLVFSSSHGPTRRIIEIGRDLWRPRSPKPCLKKGHLEQVKLFILFLIERAPSLQQMTMWLIKHKYHYLHCTSVKQTESNVASTTQP